jgi:carbonic anhydrase
VINAVNRYKNLVDEGKLTVVGAIYDFVNALGKGHGRVVITSVNGIADVQKIKALPQLAGLDLSKNLSA